MRLVSLSNRLFLLSAASKLQIYKSIIRPVVTYGCETWSMTVTEQNRLVVFERRVLRKI